MRYTDSNRGKIQNPELAAVNRDYSGLRWGKITPSDIDCLIDCGGERYYVIESKRGDAQMSYGQRLNFERVCDGLHADTETVGILVQHDNPRAAPEDYLDARVTQYRENGKWKDFGDEIVTVQDIINLDNGFLDKSFEPAEMTFVAIDGCIDFGNRLFAIFDGAHEGRELTPAQQKTFERVCDTLQKSVPTLGLLAEQAPGQTDNPDYSRAIVKRIRVGGEWRDIDYPSDAQARTLREWIDTARQKILNKNLERQAARQQQARAKPKPQSLAQIKADRAARERARQNAQDNDNGLEL